MAQSADQQDADCVAVDAIAIPNQEPRCIVERERFHDLLPGPLDRRMRCDVEMDDALALVAYYDEGEE